LVGVIETFEKIVHNQRHVTRPVANRGQCDGKHIQAVKQVFAKPTLTNGFGQIFVCGRYHAKIGFDVTGTADSLKFKFDRF